MIFVFKKDIVSKIEEFIESQCRYMSQDMLSTIDYIELTKEEADELRAKTWPDGYENPHDWRVSSNDGIFDSSFGKFRIKTAKNTNIFNISDNRCDSVVAGVGNGDIYELPPEQRVVAGPKAWDLYREKAKTSSHPKGQPLTCHLEDDRVAVYIGLDELAFAASAHPDFWDGESGEDVPNIKVTDMVLFAKEVVRELNKEEEDGSTLVTRLLDDAVRNAVEDGCEGVDHDSVSTSHE